MKATTSGTIVVLTPESKAENEIVQAICAAGPEIASVEAVCPTQTIGFSANKSPDAVTQLSIKAK
jgi:hypothetical protein